MSATAMQCKCCDEAKSGTFLYDSTLGVVCLDCAEGIRIGHKLMKKNGIEGIYAGTCGDNEKQP
jgi:hypothetical protein